MTEGTRRILVYGVVRPPGWKPATPKKWYQKIYFEFGWCFGLSVNHDIHWGNDDDDEEFVQVIIACFRIKLVISKQMNPPTYD